MRLYSTLSRQKAELPPPPGPIRMYFCGPTVYQRIHVGNARPFLVSMWLRNWLRLQGYEVRLVENITDVNDKIYLAAPGASAKLAADAAQWYVEDTDLFGLGRPDVEPKATESVPAIVDSIERLVASGHAYAVGGDVYFRVASYPDYGQLSRQRPDQMQEEESNPRKEDPRDFALWKANKPGEDTAWESPWGLGRPGWHIECSAMAEEHLGPAFEIHGGGLDLVFPHHENELAQSRALGHDFARIWMHNGILRFTGEKMSKSLGNVVSLQDAVERWGRETMLLFFLTAHWSKPIDFSEETMEQAKAQWESFENAFRAQPMYRQGDVLLVQITEIPESARLVARSSELVVAEGEDGNKHTVANGDLELHESDLGQFLRLSAESRLSHEEHDQIVLPAGLYRIQRQREYSPEGHLDRATGTRLLDESGPQWQRFAAALDDDFNTPDALAILHEWRSAGRLDLLRDGLRVWGLGHRVIAKRGGVSSHVSVGAEVEILGQAPVVPEDVRGIAELRRQARTKGDFAEADRLRAQIEAAGWTIRDVADPPGYQLLPR
jgi:cysteinyl-tRNA synthetase